MVTHARILLASPRWPPALWQLLPEGGVGVLLAQSASMRHLESLREQARPARRRKAGNAAWRGLFQQSPYDHRSTALLRAQQATSTAVLQAVQH
jgi:hypothetical protein